MNTGEDKSSGSFVDLFKIDHGKFAGAPAIAKKEEPLTEDGVVEIDVNVEYEAPIVTEPEKKLPVGDGETKSEKKDDKKQVEKVEKVKEDALSTDFDFNVVQELIDEDLLVFDKEKEYSPTKDGLKELIKETKVAAKTEGIEEYKSKFPDVKNLIETLESGGTLDEFFESQQQVDYAAVPVEGNLQNQVNLVADWLELQHYDEDEINDTIEGYKKSGLLEKQALIARKKLGEFQENENTRVSKEKETRILEQKEKQKVEEQAFKDKVLNTREIKGFKISPQVAEKLYKSITQPDKTGATDFKKKVTPETQLLYALLVMNDFDMTKIEKEVASKEVIKLKKKLDSPNDVNANPKRGAGDVRRTGQEAVKINWNFGS